MCKPVESEGLKTMAHELGFELVGVCAPDPSPQALQAYRSWLDKGFHGSMCYLADHLPLKDHPASLLPGVQSVIAVGLNYYQESMPEAGKARIARYALGRDYHKVLRSKLKRLSACIEARYPDARCRPCVDSAPILERPFAQQAGLGWFGKSTMLINSHRGSWFFLGMLLTTVEFERDEPAVGGCGTCTRCIDACPTGALIFEEDRWQLDARRCISYLTIEHEGEIEADTAGWTFGCDVCQEVCPFNQPRTIQPLRAQVTQEPDFLARRSWPDLEQLVQVEPGAWDELTRGSPVRRAGIEGLRRNARLNLDTQAVSANEK